MSLTLLVLADPKASWLKLLGNLGPDVDVRVSNDAQQVAGLAPQADVIVNGTSNPPLLSAAIPPALGSSRVDLQACKLEYSIVSPK